MILVAQTFQSAGCGTFLSRSEQHETSRRVTGKSPEPADWKVCATVKKLRKVGGHLPL